MVDDGVGIGGRAAPEMVGRQARIILTRMTSPPATRRGPEPPDISRSLNLLREQRNEAR